MNRVLVRVMALAIIGLTVPACARQPREPLTELYTPKFANVPPPIPAHAAIRSLEQDWTSGGRETVIRDLRSSQGLLIAVALGAVFLAGRSAPGRRAALPDFLLLFCAAVPFFDVMRFFDHINAAPYLWLLDLVYTAIVLLAIALIARATLLAMRDSRDGFQPRAKTGVLAGALVVLLGLNVTLALNRAPDDAGWFVNLGAQRLIERGRLPYGDPLTTGTPAAAYGPLMYVAHVPFQLALNPGGVNHDPPDRPTLGRESRYYLPPLLATQLCATTFHIIGVFALIAVLRRAASRRTALAAAVLYCGSLAVLGIGGSDYQVGGITFISHIAPASMTLLAVALIHRPAASGVALVAAAGLGFYPALMGPVWLAYYWRDRRAALQFASGCAIAGAVLVGFVLALSSPTEHASRVQTILADTLGHHTDPNGYGRSPFGFWGQRPGWRAWAMTPVAGASSLTTPAWLAMLGYVGFAMVIVRRRGVAALALTSGVIALGFAVVKPHATATYMAWYYPLLLCGLCLPGFTSKPQEV